MGLGKYFKRVGQKAKGAIKRIGGKVIKPVKGFIKPDKGSDEGTRGEAAAQLIKQDVNRQAGSAQVHFTEENSV